MILNTLAMALERHPMPHDLEAFVNSSNIVFTSIFAVEMGLKLWVRGCAGYWSEPFDAFDGAIVITSLAEIFAASLIGADGVSFLRLLRLLRILRLARSWRSLRTVGRSLLHSMAKL